MKKIICLLLLSFIFTSCLNDDSKVENYSTETTLKNFTGSEIAIEEKDEIVLNVSYDKIMTSFKAFNKTMKLGLEPESFEIIKEDGKSYIRFYSKDNQVSTIALLKGDNKRIIIGTTVCTSTACASGGGCIPDGLFCTKCRPEGTPPKAPDGDCTRTTSS
jgi:hypothetical protein